MPLKDIISIPPYLHRKRIYVDAFLATSNNDGTERWDLSDFWVRLSDQTSNVISCELTGFCIGWEAAAPFPMAQEGYDGLQYLDIYMDLVGTPGTNLSFSVPLPLRRFFADTFMIPQIKDAIQAAMNDQGVAPFLTGTTTWSISDSYFTDGSYGSIIFTATSGATPCNIYFLFGTGPNAANSAYEQLGFEKGVDVGGSTVLPDGTTVYSPIPVRLPTFYPFRYVDVTIDEFPDFDPFARIFLTKTNEYVVSQNIPTDNVRFVTDPPRQLNSLSLHLRLPDGRKLNPVYNDGVDLFFDVLSAVPEIDVPDWMKQIFAY